MTSSQPRKLTRVELGLGAVLALLVTAFALVACSSILGVTDVHFSDAGTDGANADALGDAVGDAGPYTIGGTVSGLDGDGGIVTLRLNGGGSIRVSANGPFKFPSPLPNGAKYSVTVASPPAGHTCAVVHGTGNVHGADVTSVDVSCPSTDALLAGLSLSNGALSPAFSSSLLTYSASVQGSIFSLTTIVTAKTASSDAKVAIAGGPATFGSATATVAMSALPHPIPIVVTAANGATATTTVTIESFDAQVAYVKASNTVEGRHFGSSVALSGDGNTLAVGAPTESSNATGINSMNEFDFSDPEAGAVYVFTRSTAGTWAQQAYVKASNTGPNCFFGTSVSLSDDGNTLAVGAFGEPSAATGVNNTSPGQTDTSEPYAGAVYVFSRAGTTWTQTAYVKASNTQGGNRFGNAVALSGDGNTLAVGSFLEGNFGSGINQNQNNYTSLGSSEGAVYLYAQGSAGWAFTTYFKPSFAGMDRHFGSSVALSGNGSVLAVGSDTEPSGATGVNNEFPGQNDSSAVNSGAVYAFALSASSTYWTQTAYIKPSNTVANEYFGNSVALSSDGTTLAVGAFNEPSAATGIDNVSPGQKDTSAPDAGAVFLFAYSGGAWAQTHYVKASNTRANSLFGSSVSLADDDTLLVGASGESSNAIWIDADQSDASAADAGAAYLFQKGSAWTQTAYIKASNTRAGGAFGSAVAISSTTLAVGASWESSAAKGVNNTSPGPGDTTAPGAGAVYLLH